MNLVNLTPHDLHVANDAGDVIAVIPASGQVARVSANATLDGSVALACGQVVPLVRTEYGQVEGLPAAQPDTLLIVSGLVLAAATDRTDLIAPDTGPTAVRDDQNRIVAVRRFTRR